MLFSNKWILFCFLITAYVLTASSQPTPTSVIAKRQEDTTPENSSVADYHHVTISRTTTATATATATNKGGKGDKDGNKNNGGGGSTPTNNGDRNPEPTVIPAKTTNWYIAVYGTESGISPRMAALGAILIALGLFLCSMGYRLFRIMIGVMGLLTFGSMTWIALANCRPVSGYSMDSITMIVVPACVGVVGAAIYYFFWIPAMYLAAAFGGFIFAIFILSWRSDLVIVSLIGRPCFLGGMALLAGAATYFVSHIMLLFATSFVGAYIFMFGVDCLSRTGLIAGPQAMLNRNPYHRVEYTLSTYIYVMLAMIIVMFLMSLAWQFLFNAAYRLGQKLTGAIKAKGPAHDEAKEEGHLAPAPPGSPPPS